MAAMQRVRDAVSQTHAHNRKKQQELRARQGAGVTALAGGEASGVSSGFELGNIVPGAPQVTMLWRADWICLGACGCGAAFSQSMGSCAALYVASAFITEAPMPCSASDRGGGAHICHTLCAYLWPPSEC
jgi:hypothetical protein